MSRIVRSTEESVDYEWDCFQSLATRMTTLKIQLEDIPSLEGKTAIVSGQYCSPLHKMSSPNCISPFPDCSVT